jgi:cytoskeletal protein CcmA (bactofilin family)
MGLFNNETERKAGLDPSVVMPQSLPAQAVTVPPPSGPDTTRAGLPHKGTYAQIAGARAYLDQGSKISGKLEFEGPAQIEGQVDGEISAKDSLMIGESAAVTARIKASSIIVAGSLSGEIIASERIEIRPSGRVSGNLSAPKLIVHEGAIFEGNCAMQPEGVREDRKPGTPHRDERIRIQANGQNQP